jgi:hypothetical protein
MLDGAVCCDLRLYNLWSITPVLSIGYEIILFSGAMIIWVQRAEEGGSVVSGLAVVWMGRRASTLHPCAMRLTN